MNWLMSDNTMINLDYVMSIDREGSTLIINFSGNPNFDSETMEYDTEEDCKGAFDKIKALVMGEGDKECRPA